MASNDYKDQQKKRSTISLGKVSSNAPKRSNTISVEIKRKRSGLVKEVAPSDRGTKKTDSKASVKNINAGGLTELELQARLVAIQNAIKEDESKKHQDELKAKSDAELEDLIPALEEEVATEQPEEKESVVPESVEKDVVVSTYKRPQRKKIVIEIPDSPVIFKSSEYVRKAPIRKPVHEESIAKPTQEPRQTVVGTQIPEEIPVDPQTKSYAASKSKRRDDLGDDAVKKGKAEVKKTSTFKRGDSARKLSRDVLSRVMDNDLEERTRSVASFKRSRQKLKNAGATKDVAKVVRDVEIPDTITVGELASRMAVRAADVIKFLMQMGSLVTVNEVLDGETAELICTEFGHIPHRVSESDIENELENVVDDPKDLAQRPPIVAVMGHVDHGKTTLLDTIRKTNVVQKESGGITQHVAAYQILTKSGKLITFIDTPGHAAFSKIRERGASVTDIVVLVVAADDGIKEQTLEAISHAKAENVPIVVAINKIDKPDINIEKVKSELLSHDIVLEEYGGDVLSAQISAKQGTNLEALSEAILLQAEVMQLQANKNRSAVGTILEGRVDKGKGTVASVIIQNGTLKQGDIFVAGSTFGKVRIMHDDHGKRVMEAEPSKPVEVVGFDGTPEPGDSIIVLDSEQKAREIAEHRSNSYKQKVATVKAKSIDQMIAGHTTPTKDLNLILKADVSGSLEAIKASVSMLQHDEINVNIVNEGIGLVNETDVDFAKNTTNSHIIAFNVGISAAARDSARHNGVEIKSHNVIYHLIENVRTMMSELLDPVVEENYIGKCEVRKIFTISRFGTIAGCYVTDGIVKRADSKIKVLRSGEELFYGKIKSMRHEKDEIKEARQGHECGILAEGYNDFQEGDFIECYEIVYKSRRVD